MNKSSQQADIDIQLDEALQCRHFEPHAIDFHQRIINGSLQVPTHTKLTTKQLGRISSRPTFSILKSALSMAATLVIGLTLGYNLPSPLLDSIDDNPDDYTAILFEQDELL